MKKQFNDAQRILFKLNGISDKKVNDKCARNIDPVLHDTLVEVARRSIQLHNEMEIHRDTWEYGCGTQGLVRFFLNCDETDSYVFEKTYTGPISCSPPAYDSKI